MKEHFPLQGSSQTDNRLWHQWLQGRGGPHWHRPSDTACRSVFWPRTASKASGTSVLGVTGLKTRASLEWRRVLLPPAPTLSYLNTTLSFPSPVQSRSLRPLSKWKQPFKLIYYSKLLDRQTRGLQRGLPAGSNPPCNLAGALHGTGIYITEGVNLNSSRMGH